MGQAKARGTRDERVQQSLARRMDSANRRVEFEARLTERFGLVKRLMEGDTTVQLPESLMARLRPLGVTAVGVGLGPDDTVLIDPKQLAFSPEAAADAYAASENPQDVNWKAMERRLAESMGIEVVSYPAPTIGIDPGAPEGDRTVYWNPNPQLPTQDPADAELEAAVHQLVNGTGQ